MWLGMWSALVEQHTVVHIIIVVVVVVVVRGCFVLWQQLRDEVAITVILFLGQANYVVMGFGWSASAATAAAHENRK